MYIFVYRKILFLNSFFSKNQGSSDHHTMWVC